LGPFTFIRYAGFIAKNYPVLALSAALSAAWVTLRDRDRLSIWHFQLVSALMTGAMGTLDRGSSDNVYIPMGTWLILMGTIGLHKLATRFDVARRYRVHLLALLVTFSAFAYNPLRTVASTHARESYSDLVRMLDSLDGNVYAPSLGQLQSGYTLYPAAHWVALQDMVRGPGRNEWDHPNTRRLLGPALHPDGPAYILTNYPLMGDSLLGFLEYYYVMDTDLGDRFEPLRVLPARWDHGWPRYLYRYAPEQATTQSLDSSGQPTEEYNQPSNGFQSSGRTL
jgi:hypothetical protein